MLMYDENMLSHGLAFAAYIRAVLAHSLQDKLQIVDYSCGVSYNIWTVKRLR